MCPCSQMITGRRGPKCQCRKMIGRSRSITNDGNTVFCVGGSCKSNNVIYCVRCTLCKNFNCYVGKTVANLHERINQHRASFNKLIKRLESSQTSRISPLNFEVDDETILGAHLLFEHNKHNVSDFNDIYTVDILCHCNPSEIRSKEQFFIHKLKTLTPYGLNQCNSVGDWRFFPNFKFILLLII